MDQVTQSIIETVRSYPENFEWTPSLSMEPIGKEELIHELENGGKMGRMFIDRIIHGTMRRMQREINRKRRRGSK